MRVCLSVCPARALTFESLDPWPRNFTIDMQHTNNEVFRSKTKDAGTSSKYLGQVRTPRPSGQGQGHRSKEGYTTVTKLGLHRISYPAPAPAEIRLNFHIRAYPAPAWYGRRIWGRIWGRIWPSFDASASLCNLAGIHCFTNSVICTSLFHYGHVDRTRILVSVCIPLLVT